MSRKVANLVKGEIGIFSTEFGETFDSSQFLEKIEDKITTTECPRNLRALHSMYLSSQYKGLFSDFLADALNAKSDYFILLSDPSTGEVSKYDCYHLEGPSFTAWANDVD